MKSLRSVDLVFGSARTSRTRAYDFDAMQPKPNPYSAGLTRQVAIRLGEDVIAYFEGPESGVPYQSLIDLYLRDCARHHRRPSLTWLDDPS